MLALQVAMAGIVVLYYEWPFFFLVLSHLAAGARAGGILAACVANAFAGGVLSELSLVYFRDKGRWTARHLDGMIFKSGFFFVNGAIVFEFYVWQRIWFGEGTGWSVLLPKILVDQFIFSVLWALPFQTLTFRWHNLGYSFGKLRAEWGSNFIVERMLPILIANWMFWIPGVTFIYSMPSDLQMPLAIFANATWGVLLLAVSRQEGIAPPVTELVPT